MTNNKNILKWIKDISSLTKPKNIVWIDGSKSQLDMLKQLAEKNGEIIKLNSNKLPGCYLYRSNENDVARCEHRTFICCKNKSDAGITNNWMNPNDAYIKLRTLFDGSMVNKTMYIVPFCMGHLDSNFSKIGIEITDSISVVLNMSIMTQIGEKALDTLGAVSNNFTRCLHATKDIDENNRYICHFPEDNTIWSINSGFGGNVLLFKKSLALRIASYQGYKEGWLAEHMSILGVEFPNKQIKYILAAFPSSCGKTTLAMLSPPEIYKKSGYKVWCVGDDISWIRQADDGRLWAINPEHGFFGLLPGINEKTNPNALKTINKDTIFTNVVHDLDNNTVWWEGLNDNPPKNALDWKGLKWDFKSNVKGAQPNSRFTTPIKNYPYLSPEYENPNGVPISAIIFGGKRTNTMPLVCQSFDWNHGVFLGSIMSSETTAASEGKTGIVRHDPMAMLPFCGYNIGDYFKHWIDIGNQLGNNAPKIFHVNWFRKDKNNNFIWPGFSENMRILSWILERCDNNISAEKTPIGFTPLISDINVHDLNIDMELLTNILTVDNNTLISELDNINNFFNSIGEKLPKELKQELKNLYLNLHKDVKE